MNNDNFLIEEIDLEFARETCQSINDSNKRNIAVANVLAGNIAKKYFTEIEVDTESGLHNIAFVLNKLEISDIYINNCFIDVRIYFNDNELCIPKELFDRGIAPIAFMFIKLTEDLSGASVTGFLPANEIDISRNDKYIHINEESLLSFYDIYSLIAI